MGRINNFFKNKSKLFLGIVLGIAISASVVYAESCINAANVNFTSSSGLTSTNVQAAIDEISRKVKDCPAGYTCSKKVCKVVSGSGTNIGDEINCASENFYVYKVDGEVIKMLSKYNLQVGNSTNSFYPPSSETYLQSPDTKICFDSPRSTHKAAVKFSTGSTVYSGSIAENYVGKYKDKLLSLGVPVLDATLITKDEVTQLGCTTSEASGCSSSNYPFVYSTSYWTKSVSTYDSTTVYQVSNKSSSIGGVIYTASANSDSSSGIRPVIVINKSSISN